MTTPAAEEAPIKVERFLPAMRNLVTQLMTEDEAITKRWPMAKPQEFRMLFAKLLDAILLLERYDAVILANVETKPVYFRHLEPLMRSAHDLRAILKQIEKGDTDQIAKLLAESDILSRVETLMDDTDREMKRVLGV